MNRIVNIPKLNFPAYLTSPESNDKYTSIILIHEIWGLNDHIKDVAERLKNEGYVVLAVDLFAEEGFGKIDPSILQDMQDPEKKDEAQKKMRAILAPINSPDFSKKILEKLEDAFQYLKTQPFSNNKIGVMGFCFGGTYSFELASIEKDLSFAIPFYGHSPKDESNIKNIQAPILAFYGENDTAIREEIPQLEMMMKKNNKIFEYIIYPDTGHAFFNNTNINMYNEKAAKDAWSRVLKFLSKF